MGREVIRVAVDESYEELVARILNTNSKDLYLVIPTEGTMFSSSDDIVELRKRGDRLQNLKTFSNDNQVQLTIISQEKRVLDLASMFRFPLYYEPWNGEEEALNLIITSLEETKRIETEKYNQALKLAQKNWPSTTENAFTKIRVTTTINLKNPVAITLGNYIELSLDCASCLKTARTVYIFEDKSKSFCTPKFFSKHPYKARILEAEIITRSGTTKITYLIEYPYLPFVDIRFVNSDLIPEHALSQEIPNWARINFNLKCPECGEEGAQRAIQTNVIKTASEACQCGYMYWGEQTEIFTFEKIS